MKTIHIKHLGKTEGHGSFLAKLYEGQIKEAKLETLEGVRLMEGILQERLYSDAPIITSRICGICPVVHNLTAISAIENVFNLKVNQNISRLRQIMLLCQIIHSHVMHLTFLSLPDFFDISDDLVFIKKFSVEVNKALTVREWALQGLDLIAGRVVHPINSEVGGFRAAPSLKKLFLWAQNLDNCLQQSLSLFSFIAKIKFYPFSRPTLYLSLEEKNKYAFYGKNKIKLSANKQIAYEKFLNNICELQENGAVVKKVRFLDQPFMVGALARLNNNGLFLHPLAKKSLMSLKLKRPLTNPFYNLLAQAIEVIHCLEELKILLKDIEKIKVNQLHEKVVVGAGMGGAFLEAPRGILYHFYEIDKNGFVRKANIITPTAAFLDNLDYDLKALLAQTDGKTKSKRNLLIKSLIRAYDPCISCATH